MHHGFGYASRREQACDVLGKKTPRSQQLPSPMLRSVVTSDRLNHNRSGDLHLGQRSGRKGVVLSVVGVVLGYSVASSAHIYCFQVYSRRQVHPVTEKCRDRCRSGKTRICQSPRSPSQRSDNCDRCRRISDAWRGTHAPVTSLTLSKTVTHRRRG